MAYKNFVPTVYAAAMEKQLKQDLVFVQDCLTDVKTKPASVGDTIKFTAVAPPSVTEHDARTEEGKVVTVGEPEVLDDLSMSLTINHYSVFNFMVGDLDQAQMMHHNLLKDSLAEASTKLAEKMDAFVGGLAADGAVQTINTGKAITVTADNVLQVLSDAKTLLWKNGVSKNAKLSWTVPPEVQTMLEMMKVLKDTDNSEVLKNGGVGRVNGVLIRMSNNVAVDSEGNFLPMLRTMKAVGFAHALTKIRPYEPEKGMADAVKGLALYDGKILRPKEIVVPKLKVAATEY